MSEPGKDFIREMIAADVKSGKHGGKVCTRFPPEPNGYLHIGHAKSICLNFGAAAEFGGVCHLRMDDTNPTTEDPEYVAAIQRDVRWLGFDWADKMFYASDYYERLFELAEKLIRLGRAYVCELTEEQMGEFRGTISEPGKNSPFRDRSGEENLRLFRRMRNGDFAEGAATLRAKIDMASPNMKMRDPPLYRIKHAHHYRTKDAWCIYPLYDYAHCLSDSFEGITHSLCTMEFESARELYDWVIAATEVPWVPRQTEFARLNLTYTVMSKRKLLELVTGGHVRGWDDPRMPTLAGLRRRGVTPEAVRDFCGRIGVAKNLSTVDVALFEHTVREDLNARAPRVMAVLRPLRVVIENWSEGEVEELDAPYWPHDVPSVGSRKLPFGRELYIEESDFAENPPKDYYRLAPGRQVRLRHAYIVRCTDVKKGPDGAIVEVRCTYDPATRGGAAPAGSKVDGTIHWVCAPQAVDVEVRLYDRLFSVENPGESGRDFKEEIHPKSLEIVRAKVEPSLRNPSEGERYQFERLGYFVVDPDSKPGAPVFNRTVGLKDSWAKLTAKREERPKAPSSASPGAGVPRKGEEPKAIHVGKNVAPPSTLELSDEARALSAEFGLGAEEARTLTMDVATARLFRDAVSAGAQAKAAAVFIANDVIGELRSRRLDQVPFHGAAVAELLELVKDGTLSTKLAKDVLVAMFEREGTPKAIVDQRGLRQITDTGALEAVVTRVLRENAEAVERYRAGNVNVLGALVGLTLKASGGKANPKLVTDLLKKSLG